MQRWTLIGGLGGGLLAVGVHQLGRSGAESATRAAPELTTAALSVSGRGPAPVRVDPDVRVRTSGVRCVLTSAVRGLPEAVEVRTPGQVRHQPVRNAIDKSGQAAGEIVLPYALLDDVDWTLSDVQVVADDGAIARLEVDPETRSCVAALPVAPATPPTEVRCPVADGLAAPRVRRVYLWDNDLLPDHWEPVMAVSDGDAFVLFDVPPTGTAELSVGVGRGLQLSWKDGVCAPVVVAVDAQLCVQVAGGELLFEDPSYQLFIDDTPVPLDGEGVACGETRVGDALVTQLWRAGEGGVERTVSVKVREAGRQDVEIRPLAYPTAAGLLLWPTEAGPRVVSVNGLAEVAGVRDGDLVVAIDGVPTTGPSLPESVAALDGRTDVVAITVERADTLVDLAIHFAEDGDDDTGH